MKLIKTIHKIIEESEELYNKACESCTSIEELDRLENQYKSSLRLLKMYKYKEKDLKKNKK